jgi:S1-C subfamily serine protease
MTARWLLAATAALSLVPGAAGAQDARRRVEAPLPGDVAPNDELIRMMFSRRARLGVKVNLRAQASDSIGATIDAVGPGGPAAKAGLRAGDIITKLDGHSVLDGPDGPSEKGQSLPGLRLVELAARLEPDDTVTVEYRRGADRKTATLITWSDAHTASISGPDSEQLGRAVRRNLLGLRMADNGEFGPIGDFMILTSGELADLDLAPMNPDLGQYFGATEGVLVVNVPKNSSLGLKAGDVVLAVDGRKPSGPSHLLRILRSYDRGETFKLDVLRNRKRETVTAHLGDPRSRPER